MKQGLKGWVWQRISAVVLGAYGGVIMVSAWIHPMTLDGWRALLFHPWMKALGVAALLALVIHAWIGLYTVATDYVKCRMLQRLAMALTVLSSLGYLVWGVKLLLTS